MPKQTIANPDPMMPSLVAIDKRIVVRHRSGLHQILGCTSQLPGRVEEVSLLPEVDFITHKAPASLIAVKDRYVIYNELMADQASGKLGEFHPEQR